MSVSAGWTRELGVAGRAATAAGAIILRHYLADDAPPEDKADGSPVTRADVEANEEILRQIRTAFPDDAILSEETFDDRARIGSPRVWIVDPLDGTRDFVRKTGDFAVHVGFCVDGQPVAAALYAPVAGVLQFATRGGGAFEHSVKSDNSPRKLAVSGSTDLNSFRLGVSRFLVSGALAKFVATESLGKNAVQIGASIKMMALARGELEATICLNDSENEWDSCAPGLIVTEAGGQITDLDGAPFRYNQADVRHRRGIVVSNGTRHAELVRIAQGYFA